MFSFFRKKPPAAPPEIQYAGHEVHVNQPPSSDRQVARSNARLERLRDHIKHQPPGAHRQRCEDEITRRELLLQAAGKLPRAKR